MFEKFNDIWGGGNLASETDNNMKKFYKTLNANSSAFSETLNKLEQTNGNNIHISEEYIKPFWRTQQCKPQDDLWWPKLCQTKWAKINS